LKPIFGESGVIRFARDFPKDITFEPPPCTWFIRKIQKPNSQDERQQGREDRPPGRAAGPLRIELHAVVGHLRLEVRRRLVTRIVDRALLAVP